MQIGRKIIYFVLLISAAFSLQTTAQQSRIQTGHIAPEIRLPNVKGDTLRLSSMHGKVVLIDFWASWCEPCVKEQPELAILRKKAGSGQKFEILGVSLDSKKPAWEKAILRLGIDWPQVSDLKFWMSPVAKTYEIDALPFNVLVDAGGKIVAVNLHGKALEEAVIREIGETK